MAKARTITATDPLTGQTVTRITARTYHAAVVWIGADGALHAHAWAGRPDLAAAALAKVHRAGIADARLAPVTGDPWATPEPDAPVATPEPVAEPSLADLFAAQSAVIKAEGDAAHASALSTIAAMRSTIDAILMEPEVEPVAAVPVASPKLPRVKRLKRFAVSFTVPGPTGGDLPGWVTVKAADFDSAGAWFHDHRAALGLPSTAQIDTIRTA